MVERASGVPEDSASMALVKRGPTFSILPSNIGPPDVSKRYIGTASLPGPVHDGIYTGFPPDAKAMFSSDFGKRPVRQLQRNAPTTIHTNFLQDIGSKAEFYVKRYREYLVETDLKPPINYSDLYPYFDPFDLWVEGPGFLYHVTCRVVQISINMREQLAAFANAWCNKDINNEKLSLVRVGVPFDKIFSKVDWDFIDADRLPHHEVGKVLSQIQRIAHIRFPDLPAIYAISQNLPSVAQEPLQYGNSKAYVNKAQYGASRQFVIDNTQFGSSSKWGDNSESGIDTVTHVFRLFGDNAQITQSAPRLVSHNPTEMGAPILYPMTPQRKPYPHRGQAVVGDRSSSAAMHSAFAWQVEDPFPISIENNDWIHSLNALDAETHRQNSKLSASDTLRLEDASTPIQQTSMRQPSMNQGPMHQAQNHHTPVHRTEFCYNFQQGPLGGPRQFARQNSESSSSSASRLEATPDLVQQDSVGSHAQHEAFDGAHQPTFEDLSDDNHNPSQRLQALQGDVVWTNKLERPVDIKAPKWAVESKNRVTETFLVNAGATGAIIGRGGSHIEGIKNKWDCVVKLSESDTYEGFRTCWITGRPRQREGAAFHVVGLVENWRAKVVSGEWRVAPPRLRQFNTQKCTLSMEGAEDGCLQQRMQQSACNARHRTMNTSGCGSWNKTIRPSQLPHSESFERLRSGAQPPGERLEDDSDDDFIVHRRRDDVNSVIAYKSDDPTGFDMAVRPQKASGIDVNNNIKPIVPTPLSKPSESALTHSPQKKNGICRPSKDLKAIQRDNQRQNRDETPKSSPQKNFKENQADRKGKAKTTHPKHNAAFNAPEALRDLGLSDSNNWPTLGGAKPGQATRGRGWHAIHEEPEGSMACSGSLDVPEAFAALAVGLSDAYRSFDASSPSLMGMDTSVPYDASSLFDNRRGSFSNVVARHRPAYVPAPPQPMVRNNRGRGAYGNIESKAKDWEWPVATSSVEAAQMANMGKVAVLPNDASMTQSPQMPHPSARSPQVVGARKGNDKDKRKITTFASAAASVTPTAICAAICTVDATAATGDNSARGSKSSSEKKKIGKWARARRAREVYGSGDSDEGADASGLGLGGAHSSGNVDNSIGGGARSDVRASAMASRRHHNPFAGTSAQHAQPVAQSFDKADWFKAQKAWNGQAEKEKDKKPGKYQLSTPW